LYAPDFVINAGGVIHIHQQHIGHSNDESRVQIEKIGDTLLEIFQSSDEQKRSTIEVAEQLAETKFKQVKDTHKGTKKVA